MFRRHGFLALSAATLTLAAMLAVFVPHRAQVPATPMLQFRDHVIFDNVGLISPAFDSAKSGLLLQSEPLVQFLIYIAPRPPQEDLETYTLETASAWKIGSERGDNGIVLFIFPDERKARLEVGYGLEGALPDGLVRDLLDGTLVVQFARGAYEAGIDEFIGKILETLDDDAALRREEATSDSRGGTIRSAFTRVPRLARLAWRMFVDADLNGRFAVELFVLVALSIVGSAVFFLYKIIAAVVLLPQHWRASATRKAWLAAGERNAARHERNIGETLPLVPEILGDLHLFDVVAGSAGFALSFVFILAFMLNVEDFLPRKGHFGGVTVVLPMPPGSGAR